MSITKLNNLSISAVTALPSGVGGKVLQVITATDEVERTITSTSYVTGSNTLSVSITPSSASNKIFVIASLAIVAPSATYRGEVTVYRGATNLSTNQFFKTLVDGTYLGFGGNISFLDSPSTTSSTTYQVYAKIESGGNRIILNAGSSKGTITAFEIGT